MTRLWQRRSRIDAAHVDVLFACALIVEGLLEAWLLPSIGASSRPAIALAATLAVAPVAFRRRAPALALLTSCAVIATASAIVRGFEHTQGDVLAPIALAYGVGAWLELSRALPALLLAIALLMAGFTAQEGIIASDALWAAALIGLPWFAGRLLRERARRADAFRALAAEADTERRERERAAIAQERARIGRELHDIIAHSVSAMVVHAGGARALLRSEPDRARESILTLERTGRETLAEMRRLLGLLRRDDDPRALAPQPGLDRLPELAASLRSEGLGCELLREGEPVDLTPGVDLVGYRVIERALGHFAEHRCPRTTVTVRYGSRRLELDVAGAGPAPHLGEALRGVSDRVGLYHGSLDIAPAGGDGLEVRCELPLEAVAT
jgi:signal transduction histidine kinase